MTNRCINAFIRRKKWSPFESSCPPWESNGVINGERTNIDSMKCKGTWEFTHQSSDYACLSRWMFLFFFFLIIHSIFIFFKHLRKQDRDIQLSALVRFSRCSRSFLKKLGFLEGGGCSQPKSYLSFQFDISTGGTAWAGQWVICLKVFLLRLSVRQFQKLTLHHLHYGSSEKHTFLGIWTYTGLERIQEFTT